ncbi:DUF3566 domain-containing protein [Mycobacterium deserti]|uniref:DUF3566 domain-containing protein n=1 Tax=Mycobacterium deserti TaxID=2978347 RepID=A0ABT2MG54_9MYCO|nr:DUF3566 domain-containing protein [Mycobacterium deserti]MCT7661274.1 DUF3566 domain-containing protein [Mycobacterium deserti]
MSSPNEPGYPRAGDSPGGNGSVPGLGPAHDGGSLGNAATRRPVGESGDVPPWQRGPAARAAGQTRREPEPPTRSEAAARTEAPRGASGEAPRPTGGGGGHSPAVDARLNRFLSGSSAPTHEQEAPARSERPEAYASELPDLSGPTPRPRKATPDRPAPEPPSRPATAPTGGRMQVGARPHGPVRASMQIRRIDPWSTLKVSLVLSVALFFVWMIAVAFLYLVLGGMGVWSKLNSNVGDLLTSASGSTGGELVSSGTIFGGAALIGLVNIVLLTAMATIGVFIYNLTTDIVGGVEVTLADRD